MTGSATRFGTGPRRHALSRRAWLGAGPTAALTTGLLLTRTSHSAPPFTASQERHEFTVTLDANVPGVTVNRRVLGSNVGWAWGGDNLVDADGRFAPKLFDMARRLAPTVLRYPGGTYSDLFHWDAPVNEHVFNRQAQPTLMDTQRFLELCEAVGAEPLLTVNLVTGSTEDAARWLTATNVRGMTSRLTGRRLPKVRFWELGNEPYLKEETRPELNLAPAEFARRANRFIIAMRTVDATISIGLPLTNDTRAGMPVTPYPGFTRQVLEIVGERFDYASVHDAYMPFAYQRVPDPAALYWGAAAGALTVEADLAAMTRLLAELRPGQRLPLAITEYSPLFSLGRGPTDRWTTSPAGAVYVADLLRVFARNDDVLMAHHWSLSANGLFGAIHADGHARPVYEVLRLMGEALVGERIGAAVRAGTVATRSIGQSAGALAMPLVEVLATRATGSGPDGRTLRVFVINKDPQRAATGRIDLGGVRIARADMSLLTGADVFDASDAADVFVRHDTRLDTGGSTGRPFSFAMPPHSVALLTLQVPGT